MKYFFGFSLIEILCALAISMVVLCLAMGLFMSYREAERYEKGLSDLQENLRFSAYILYHQLSGLDQKKLQENRFFRAKTGRVNKAGDEIWALYWQDDDGSSPAEVITGVFEFELNYWVKINGKLEKRDAKEITDWRLIRGLFITLGIQSEEPVSLQPIKRYLTRKFHYVIPLYLYS